MRAGGGRCCLVPRLCRELVGSAANASLYVHPASKTKTTQKVPAGKQSITQVRVLVV